MTTTNKESKTLDTVKVPGKNKTEFSGLEVSCSPKPPAIKAQYPQSYYLQFPITVLSLGICRYSAYALVDETGLGTRLFDGHF